MSAEVCRGLGVSFRPSSSEIVFSCRSGKQLGGWWQKQQRQRRKFKIIYDSICSIDRFSEHYRVRWGMTGCLLAVDMVSEGEVPRMWREKQSCLPFICQVCYLAYKRQSYLWPAPEPICGSYRPAWTGAMGWLTAGGSSHIFRLRWSSSGIQGSKSESGPPTNWSCSYSSRKQN